MNPNKLENNGRNSDGTFKKGTIGNPNGRPKRKTITELLHERLDKEGGWEDLIGVILSMVKKKDREIIKELWHQTDGMPKQKIEATGADGEPLRVIITEDKPKEDEQ